jgi:hypothetical protein
MSFVEILYLVGVILVVGFILGIMERVSNDFMQRAFGRNGIMITAWLGTPVHEIGHALMCIVFRHNITNIKLLNTKSDTEVLGYVKHSYNPNSLYQRIGNLFIGLGPIFSGTASLITALYLLLPKSFNTYKTYLVQGINSDKIGKDLLNSILSAGITLTKSIFTIQNISNICFWIFLLIAICVASHIALSKADMIGAKDGLIVLFVLIFLVNIVLRYFSINTVNYIVKLSRYNAHLIGFLMIALVFSAFTLVISLVCYGIALFKR